MNKQSDPVDSALNMLRSEQWAAEQPFDPDLENRLMQDFNTHQSPRRFASPKAMLLALAFLTVGGVTLAATDGVAKLKQWFVTLEINGERLDVELDENGESTFDYEMADGTTATVNIQKTDTPEDGQMTQIRVTAGDDQTENVEVAKICQKIKVGGANLALTIDDLEDAELVKSWSDAKGTSFDLYTRVQKNGDWIFFVASQPTDDEEPDVRQVARIPTTVLPADSEPTFEIGTDGTLSITLNDGEGRVQELKLRFNKQEGDSPKDCTIRTQSGDEITIKVDQIDEQQGPTAVSPRPGGQR